MSKEREKQGEGDVTPSHQYQPSKAELEADVSIPATPDELLEAMMNYKAPVVSQFDFGLAGMQGKRLRFQELIAESPQD